MSMFQSPESTQLSPEDSTEDRFVAIRLFFPFATVSQRLQATHSITLFNFLIVRVDLRYVHRFDLFR
jgi:hypothetical protein